MFLLLGALYEDYICYRNSVRLSTVGSVSEVVILQGGRPINKNSSHQSRDLARSYEWRKHKRDNEAQLTGQRWPHMTPYIDRPMCRVRLWGR